MKPGDLVILKNELVNIDGVYGYGEHLDKNFYVPNGTIGMCLEPPRVPNGKFCVLVLGQSIWFDPLDALVIDETG